MGTDYASGNLCDPFFSLNLPPTHAHLVAAKVRVEREKKVPSVRLRTLETHKAAVIRVRVAGVAVGRRAQRPGPNARRERMRHVVERLGGNLGEKLGKRAEDGGLLAQMDPVLKLAVDKRHLDQRVLKRDTLAVVALYRQGCDPVVSPLARWAPSIP